MKSVSDEYPHLSRWHRHIKSYGTEKSKLGGPKKTLKDFGVTGSTSSASAANDDDDVDLFGSDDEVDEAAEKAREERLKAYAEKKSKSKSRFFSNQKDSKLNLCFFLNSFIEPGPIAKSNVVLDVKPWDDETDMKAMEESVRSIEMGGLKWGASKLVPLAYGIKKLQIVCVVEDEKGLQEYS